MFNVKRFIMKKVFMAMAVATAMIAASSCSCNNEKAAEESACTKDCSTCTKACEDKTECETCDSTAVDCCQEAE